MIIDGKNIANKIQEEIKNKTSSLVTSGNRPPKLAVVLVGEDPASQVYVAFKEKACKKVGFASETYRVRENKTTEDVCGIVASLNADKEVDGILVQLPLPQQIDSKKVIAEIDPLKDVDGLTVLNQGFLALNQIGHRPCTPLGVLHMIEHIDFDLEGKLCAVIGRSNLVGSPLAKMLTHKNATVINIHSRTSNPKELVRQCDLVVVAAGKKNLVDETWIKNGAVVIDVGIHRDENNKLVGDVLFEQVKEKAASISPVPGGVGPMTIACLLSNCLSAYQQSFLTS